MRLKRYLLTGIFVVFLTGLGGAIAFAYMGNRIAQLLAFQQEAALVEWNQITFQAYQSETPEVAVWAFKNYVNKVNSIYSVLPKKDREYYYLSFVAHARLAKLYRRINDHSSETNELHLAEADSIGWSNEKKTNEASIFKALEEIDEVDVKGSVLNGP